MANIQSNEKSRLQDDKRNLNNKSLKNQIKTAMKKAKAEKTHITVNEAVRLINSAVAKGVFQENKGARLVSKMQTINIVEIILRKSELKDVEKDEKVVEEAAPVVKKPAAKKPVAKKPAAKSTTATKKPAAKKPAAKKPSTTAAKKPATKSTTTTKKPATKKVEPKEPTTK